MSYILKIEEEPSPALRDWFEADLFVELHCSQPKFEFKILEENSEPTKDVVLDDDNLPKIEHKLLGVSQ